MCSFSSNRGGRKESERASERVRRTREEFSRSGWTVGPERGFSAAPDRFLYWYERRLSSCCPLRAMASSERQPGAPPHQESWRRTVHLLRKMRSDVSSLLECYVEKQELAQPYNLDLIDVDLIDGVPVADVEEWSEISDAERLGSNLQAYWAFQILLDQILEEQRTDLTPEDVAFHESIQSVLLQVSALAYQLEELMVKLKHNVPAKEVKNTTNPDEKSLFERKIRGMKVLQELGQWTVRSVRDLHKISTSVQASSVALESDSLTQAQEK
ncbi:ciliary neurotrophic factor [Crotalus tigris]|uniref:ciliary neurotrophic factor n=1 Tax=Crotalus tigris TaxID=88082 RepID=UPI00192F4B47|nr:ciliary neurotrophic factor [Crotalus tigris]